MCDFYEESICDDHFFCDEGYCTNCGTSKDVINFGYKFDMNEIKNSREPTAVAKIKDLKYPIEILETACNVCVDLVLNNPGKSKKQSMLIFASLIYAHRIHKQCIDPKEIASTIGMKFSEMNKALTRYPYDTDYIETPEGFITGYAAKLNMTDIQIENLMKTVSEILEKYPEFKERNPQCVSAAILIYFMNINGITYNKIKLASIINRRIEGAITEILRKIL